MSTIASGPAAVVVGLDCITGLQTARILHDRAIPVIGVAGDPAHFACRSRAVGRLVGADVTSEQLISALEALGPTLAERAVLFPCTDQSVMLISRHRAALEPWFHVVLPEHEHVELLMDKVKFTRYGHERGLPLPPTRFVSTRVQAESAAAELRFPVVVKPALKTARWQSQGLAKVYRAATPERLLDLFTELSSWTDELIVQEWIEGADAELFSCNCYFDRDGVPAVTFVARKLRQWPPGAGTSSLGEEVRNDDVLDETLRLFKSVDYRGLGYVEIKRDPRTGRNYVIEPNVGRPTGRSSIAEAGGVELLYTMYRDAIGASLPTARFQRYAGAKWMYLRHDLQSAIVYVLRGDLTLSEWRRSWSGPKVDAVWSRHDPAPFFWDWAQTIVRLPLKARAHLRTRLRLRPAKAPAVTAG
jgi:predicted ATP-grasp superfamily ATP-dependent carboligase